MDQHQQIRTIDNPSKLERFLLGFEYDKTLQQVKRETRVRSFD